MRTSPRSTRRPTRTRIVALAGAVLLTLGVSACDLPGGGDDSSSAPKAVAVVDDVQGKTTSIALSKDFTGALTALKLTPGVTGGAKLTDKGSLVFPITGGNVTVFKPGEVSPYVIGQLQHEGSGLTLAAGGTTVRLSNFVVDPGASRVYGDVAVNGKTAVASAFLFQLDGRTLKKITVKSGIATLTGTKVEISPVAAGLLNDTFKTKAVKAGLLVGIATIEVSTKSK